MGIRNDYDVFSPNQYEDVYYEAPIIARRAPTARDKYEIGKVWIDKSADDIYFLTNITSGSAVWINAGGGAGVFASVTASTGDITADVGDIVATVGNLNIVAGTITFGLLTLGVVQSSAAGALSSSTGTDGQILIDATAGAPTWANLTAGAGINITNAANSVTITATGAVASTFPCDGGTATPAAGATTIAGGTNITTAGAGSTATINLDDSPSVAGSLTAGVDLTMTSGDCTITGTTDAPQTIYLHANGGVTETIDIHSDQGTGVDSIWMHSDLGGLTLASGLANADAINITAAAGGVDIDGAMSVNIASSQNASDALVLSASAGGIDITSSGGAAEDIDITATSSINLVSTENAALALYLHANGGALETIDIHSDQGTDVASINLHSDLGGITLTATGNATNDAINIGATAGGIDIDAALQLNIASSQAAADAIVIDASDAAGGIDIDYGTGGMSVVGGNGAFVLETGTGNIDIGADAAAHVITIGNVSGATEVAINTGTAGFNVATTGTGDITLDSDDTVLIDSDGVLELNSSAGIIGIGNDAVSQNINIGIAGERVVTIGSTTTASQVVVDCGTAGASFGASANVHTTTVGGTTGASALTAQSGTGAMTFTAGGTFDVNATDAVTIDSSAGTIGIAVNDIDQHVNIAIDGERTTTIGSTNGAAGVVVDCGTTGASFGASATAHTTTLGSTNTTCITTLQSGSGAMTFTAGGIFDVNATGAVTIDSSAGTIGIAVNDIDQHVNISTDGERTTTIGSTNGAAGVVVDCGTTGASFGASATAHTTTLGSTNTTCITTLQSGSGAMTFTAGGIVDVNATGAVTIDSTGGAISIGAGADAQAVNVGTGAAARSVTVGSVDTTSSTLIQSGTGDVTITSTDDIVHTASGDVTFNTDVTLITATTGVVFQEGPKVIAGAGAPGISAPKGSLYLRTNGTTTNDRAYINTDGSTTWTALTTAA